jgi:hypothetical protein
MSAWPFADPPNLATITVRQIIDREKPILLVCHDEDDGGWQFLTGGAFDVSDGLVVSLQNVTKIDPSVMQLADLPVGWSATRASASHPWQRECHPSGAADRDHWSRL